MIPTAPLTARNRLAALILRALADEAAGAALAALADERAAARWVAPEERPAAAAIARRAAAAAAALAARPRPATDCGLASCLAAAALLFDAGLHFETHELLEPAWAGATGDAREALQGLIQVAVGWQHLANGNEAGARSLLAEGARRLHGRTLAGIALEDFARATAAAAARLPDVDRVPPFPRRSPSAGPAATITTGEEKTRWTSS